MNPELERRLRHYGATVDAAADAADARRRPTAADTSSLTVADLDNVVVIGQRPHRFYRALAVAAATVAVVAGGFVVFAIGRSAPSTSPAHRAVASTEPEVVERTTAATSRPTEVIDPTTTTARPTTTTVASAASTPLTAAEARPTTPPVCPSYTPNNDYHLGICDSGPAIRLAQERLRASVDSSLIVDGYFGPGTRAAVRTFQQLHGLAVDGYIGPNTWRALVPDAPGTDVDGNGVVDPAEISSG
jgi:Putative peptidoglycan binding domain